MNEPATDEQIRAKFYVQIQFEFLLMTSSGGYVNPQVAVRIYLGVNVENGIFAKELESLFHSQLHWP